MDNRGSEDLPIRYINYNLVPYVPVPPPRPVPPPFLRPVHVFVVDPFLSWIEAERSKTLLQFLHDEGLVPTPEQEMKRRNVINILKEIVMDWVKRVAHHYPPQYHHGRAASATILTYGSYGLGVHNSESDIDALCVCPWFLNIREDFFILLRNILAKRPEVSDICCIKSTRVPLMRFKFDGLSIDLPYAQLNVVSVPENVDVFNLIDETGSRSLSGVRANRSTLQLVPDRKIFQSLLRCVRLWAKRRGVYGHLLGYFGGIHLAILAAFICQRHPSSTLSSLISIFFKTFAFWPWPLPVFLQHEVALPVHRPVKWPSMPIQLPSSPDGYCQSYITKSTFNRIRAEFRRGHCLTQDIAGTDFDWRRVFEPFPYAERYQHFVKICLSASNKDELGVWVGWVKSRFPSLLVKVEELLQCFCDPIPTEHVDGSISEPNVVFYWGLQSVSGRNHHINSEFVDAFMKTIRNRYEGPVGKMQLSIVAVSLLPKDAV